MLRYICPLSPRVGKIFRVCCHMHEGGAGNGSSSVRSDMFIAARAQKPAKVRRSGMWSCSLGYSPIWKSKPDSCRSDGAWRGSRRLVAITMSLLAELDRVRPAKMHVRSNVLGRSIVRKSEHWREITSFGSCCARDGRTPACLRSHSRLSKMFSIFVGLLEAASKPERSSRLRQYHRLPSAVRDKVQS